MKRCRLFIRLALLVCAAISVVLASHTSLAYITARSNTLHNSFRVVYQLPQGISVPIVIQKSMVNLTDEEVGPGGFDFHLLNVDTGEAVVATTSDSGLATMNLTFTAEDVGNTYRYRLFELNDGRENIKFDDTIYDISIRIVLNEVHELSAELTVNGQPVTEIIAEYENQYYAFIPLPDTGDHAQLLLWAVLLVVSGTGIVLLSKNRPIFRRL